MLISLTIVCTYCYSGIRKKTEVKPPILPTLDSPHKSRVSILPQSPGSGGGEGEGEGGTDVKPSILPTLDSPHKLRVSIPP